MGAYSNLATKVSPKARLLIAFVIIAVILLTFIGISRISGSNVVEDNPGESSINSSLTKEQASKDHLTDKVIFGDDTPIGELYINNEKTVVAEAESNESNKTHLSPIRVDISKLEEAKKPPKPEVVNAPKQPNLEALVAARRQKADEVIQDRTDRQARAIQRMDNPWDQFIAAEKEFVSAYQSALDERIAEVTSNSKKIALPSYGQGARVASAATNQPQSAASVSGWESYLKAGGQKPSADAVAATPAAKTLRDNTEPAVEVPALRSSYPGDIIASRSVASDMNSAIINPGDVFTAVLQIGINTDDISPVRAEIVETGPLKGAILTGDPVRSGERAQAAMVTMTVNKQSYSVKAVMLDPETMRASLADNVDNHIFERYSKLFIASVAEGYADALSDSGTQTTNNNSGGSTTTKDGLPETSDQIKVGLGKAGERFAPIFERQFERPPTVEVFPNKVVYIMFQGVTDLSEK